MKHHPAQRSDGLVGIVGNYSPDEKGIETFRFHNGNLVDHDQSRKLFPDEDGTLKNLIIHGTPTAGRDRRDRLSN